MTLRVWLPILWFVAAVFHSLPAQEKPAPPPRPAAAVDSVTPPPAEHLPEFDLPEFQITGKEEIDLAPFTKPAGDEGDGFMPPPAGPAPGERESPDFAFGGRTKEEMATPSGETGLRGKATIGYGSYQTPFFDGWFGNTGEDVDFLLRAGYKSSTGYVPFSDFRSGYGELSGGLRLPADTDMLGGTRLDALIGLQGDGYNLYGSRVADRRRTVNRFRLETSLSSVLEAGTSVKGGLGLRTTSLEDSIRTQETQVGVDGAGEGEFGSVVVRAEVSAWTSFYDAPSREYTPYYLSCGATGRSRVLDNLDMLAGGVVSIVRGSDLASRARIFPTLSAWWYPLPGLVVYGRYEPGVERNGLGAMLDQNPYLINDVPLRHRENLFDLTAGGRYEIGRQSIGQLSLRFQRSRFVPLFTDVYGDGLWTPVLEGLTRIVTLEATVDVALGEADHLGATVTLRGSSTSETGKAVPYLPDAAMSMLYRHRFPFGLTLGGSLSLLGKRYADLANTVSLPSFALLGIDAVYQLLPGLSITGSVNNLLNRTYVWWDRYTAQPRAFSLALSHSW